MRVWQQNIANEIDTPVEQLLFNSFPTKKKYIVLLCTSFENVSFCEMFTNSGDCPSGCGYNNTFALLIKMTALLARISQILLIQVHLLTAS